MTCRLTVLVLLYYSVFDPHCALFGETASGGQLPLFFFGGVGVGGVVYMNMGTSSPSCTSLYLLPLSTSVESNMTIWRGLLILFDGLFAMLGYVLYMGRGEYEW